MNDPTPRSRPLRRPTSLRFDPLAWLKLQFLCHLGDTEVGGFGVTAADDLLYVQDVQTIRQKTTLASVEFDDDAVADHFDRCAEQSIHPSRCGRIWVHTHPGASVDPSPVDEETFERVFGVCDWAVLFILGRTGRTYARLRFNAGPGGAMVLPVEVDWAAWPRSLAGAENALPDWRREYDAHVVDVTPQLLPPVGEADQPDLYDDLWEDELALLSESPAERGEPWVPREPLEDLDDAAVSWASSKRDRGGARRASLQPSPNAPAEEGGRP